MTCVRNFKHYQKFLLKPRPDSQKIFNKDCITVQKMKEVLKLNKPSYVGIYVLDLNNDFLYDIHYNFIKQKHGHQAKGLFII